mmetsp:Transcript_35476/g.63938  ORF Transcript_35476/g.63938 Transcript_35476/m.63938 type:complete len:316 (-) Transcript_35476:2786-3733(-)
MIHDVFGYNHALRSTKPSKGSMRWLRRLTRSTHRMKIRPIITIIHMKQRPVQHRPRQIKLAPSIIVQLHIQRMKLHTPILLIHHNTSLVPGQKRMPPTTNTHIRIAIQRQLTRTIRQLGRHRCSHRAKHRSRLLSSKSTAHSLHPAHHFGSGGVGDAGAKVLCFGGGLGGGVYGEVGGRFGGDGEGGVGLEVEVLLAAGADGSFHNYKFFLLSVHHRICRSRLLEYLLGIATTLHLVYASMPKTVCLNGIFNAHHRLSFHLLSVFHCHCTSSLFGNLLGDTHHNSQHLPWKIHSPVNRQKCHIVQQDGSHAIIPT